MNTTRRIHEISSDHFQPGQAYVSYDRHIKISADRLADQFCIGPKKAATTLLATTQRGFRSAILLLSRWYRKDRHFNTRTIYGKFAADTL